MTAEIEAHNLKSIYQTENYNHFGGDRRGREANEQSEDLIKSTNQILECFEKRGEEINAGCGIG